MRFEGRIRKDGKFWLVEIPAFDAVTQADAAPSARRARLLPAVVVTVVVVAAITGLVAWKGRTLLVRGGPPDALRPASLSSIGEAPSPSAEANEYFEKGLLFLRAQLDVPRARKMLDRAIEIDPTFGSARAMRALTNVIAIHEGSANDGGLVYASERDIRDILASQPDLGSAHATLGATLLYLNRKEQARQELALALQLNPQSQPAVAWLTLDDRHSGRSEAAEARARSILEGVPLFWFARITLSDILFDEGRVDEAHREIEKVFEQDAANRAAVCAMARIHLYQGDTRGARAMLEGISAATHPNFRVRLSRALLLAREGKADTAIATLDAETLKYAGIAMFAPAQVAEVYTLAGRPDEALDWLDRAVRNGDERSAWFRRDAFLAGIQDQPRFRLILDSIERNGP